MSPNLALSAIDKLIRFIFHIIVCLSIFSAAEFCHVESLIRKTKHLLQLRLFPNWNFHRVRSHPHLIGVRCVAKKVLKAQSVKLKKFKSRAFQSDIRSAMPAGPSLLRQQMRAISYYANGSN